MENTCAVDKVRHISAFGLVQHQDRTAGSEIPDGIQNTLLLSRNLNWRRPLDDRVFEAVFFVASEDLLLQRQNRIRKLDQRPHAAAVPAEACRLRHSRRASRLAQRLAHFSPSKTCRIDDLLSVSGKHHSAETRVGRQREDECDLQLRQVLYFVANDDVVLAATPVARFTKSRAAEINLIGAAGRGKPLLISLSDPKDFGPFVDEQGRALAPQIVVVALVEHRTPQIQAGAFQDAPHLLPGQRRVDARRSMFQPRSKRLVRHQICAGLSFFRRDQFPV